MRERPPRTPQHEPRPGPHLESMKQVADERIFEGVTSRAEGEGSWDPIAHLHAMSKSEHVVPLVRRQGSLVFGEEGIATTDRWQPRQTARRLTHGLL
jgi:hypothetical protein